MTLPYDDASRLTGAAYSEGNSNNNKFGTQYAYDCMGNITSLKRNGLQDGGTYGLIDDLTLSYDGNRLMSVSDAVTDPTYNNAWDFKDGADSDSEYEYDENGNLTKDLNKNISSIQYNSLNLPTQILFADGNAIRYMYSADGRKLRAEYTTAMPATTKTIDYSGNLIFENGTLKQILVDGGYIMMDDWSNPYCLYVRDHLGNNRMVVHPSGMIEQVNNYYPYGGLMANSTGWNAQRYKYNGKELDRMHGLDWYDYGARWQDAAIGGRWHAMDPLCEKYYNVSPYVYCANNPVMLVDPDGKRPTVKEAAAMATHVYGDDDAKKVNLGNWRVSRRNFGIKLTTTNGLKSAVYEKVIKGKVTEYAYVTCGSTNVQDWIENYNQTKGCSKEYMESARNAKAISEQIGDNTELTFIGHSQGGGEAALNSLVTSNDKAKGRRAITFNAAGLSGETKYNVGGLKTLLKSNRKIDAYIMITCPLNLYQNSIGTSLPHVDGNMHFIRPKDWSSLYNGHSMINLYNSIK